MSDPSRLLSEVAIGQSGCITALAGDVAVCQRLREMGLTRGARVEVVRRAPLGDPLDIRVRGYHLSIRQAEAACVRIEMNAAETSNVAPTP